jgi:hypothetical protein
VLKTSGQVPLQLLINAQIGQVGFSQEKTLNAGVEEKLMKCRFMKGMARI